MSYIELGIGDLALAATLVIANAALSFRLGLGLERQTLVAALRMVVQLALIALVLEALFRVSSAGWTALAALVMISFAGREVHARQQRTFTGAWGYGIGTSSMLFAATVVTVLALTTQIRADPWYAPRYTIPLLGMILGNTMTGVSLGLSRLTEGVADQRASIEAQLLLGASATEAMRPSVRRALHDGMIPIINAMSAAGVVSLPGMMTGQILAGVDPANAVKYQLLIMFLIAGATALGVLTAVLAGARRLTDDRHRLRLDRLSGNED